MTARVFIFFLTVLSCDTACSMTELDTLPTPSNVINSIELSEQDTITIMQWNIGHFSLGTSKKSRVTDDTFYSALEGFRDMLLRAQAAIISLNEYSYLFANTQNHPRCGADTILFRDYPYHSFGNNAQQRNYSLNAVYSAFQINNEETVEYECNKSITLSSTADIRATDYYYLRSTISLFGKETTLVSTHLAFDVMDNQVVLRQVKELIDCLQNEKYVIRCGDFNIDATDLTLFTEAGYSLANEGSLATYPIPTPYLSLDNIIVKGFNISRPRVIQTLLSDHFPILCEISLIKDETIDFIGDPTIQP